MDGPASPPPSGAGGGLNELLPIRGSPVEGRVLQVCGVAYEVQTALIGVATDTSAVSGPFASADPAIPFRVLVTSCRH